MARTAVTITSLSANAATADPAGVNLDATNDHVLTPTCPLHEIVIEVTHTTASEKSLTIKAGDNPPANASGQGDLVTAFDAGDSTAVVKHFVLSSDRFLQDDGTVNIDVPSGMTGKIRAFRVPRP